MISLTLDFEILKTLGEAGKEHRGNERFECLAARFAGQTILEGDVSTKAIEQFLMRPEEGGAYTDERLAMLLAHAQDGKLSYLSCCCFIGVATATHTLRGEYADLISNEPHLMRARTLPNAAEAEYEFLELWGEWEDDDAERRARLIPLILAEIERRERLKTPEAGSGELARFDSEVCAALN